MNHPDMIKKLNDNSDIFSALLSDIETYQEHWKPSSEKWSIVEIINHLYDEEKDDFRNRLKSVLKNPKKKWLNIDPQNRVIKENYNDRKFIDSLKNFLSERKKSIFWLESLRNPDWRLAYNHKKYGEIKAGDILAAWVAHDYFHMRQIINLKIEYVAQLASPYSIDYAT